MTSRRALFVRDGETSDFLPPRTKWELKALVQYLFGYNFPATAVCPGHSAPLDAIWDAYTAKYPIMVWKASRGFGGKSTMLATLSVLEMLTGMKVAVLGGSAQQSRRVHEVTDDIWEHAIELPNGDVIEGPLKHLLAQDPNQMETRARNGAWLRALTASTKSARGPHPQRLNLDEVDEMDLVVFDAAMGQTMEGGSGHKAGTVISSTHQYPDKTMSEVLRRADEKGWPVYFWCYKENLESNDGWLPDYEVDRKRQEVSAQMFTIEYDLTEPTIEGRAIDTDAVDRTFSKSRGTYSGSPGEYLEFESPDPEGRYATGTDWAKESDWTVIVTFRTDGPKWKMVAFERVNRIAWPAMIERLNKRLERFGGVAAHDATGAGNVVNDYIRHSTKAVILMGKERQRIFSDWIVALEQGQIEAPFIEWVYYEHLYVSVNDLYGHGTGAHPPDSLVACALAWSLRKKQVNLVAPIYRDLTKTSLWS